MLNKLMQMRSTPEPGQDLVNGYIVANGCHAGGDSRRVQVGRTSMYTISDEHTALFLPQSADGIDRLAADPEMRVRVMMTDPRFCPKVEVGRVEAGSLANVVRDANSGGTAAYASLQIMWEMQA